MIESEKIHILNKKIIGYISITLIIILGCIARLIYYVQCDDYQMNLISVGAISGKGDEHLVFIKAIYGHFIKFLNNMLPGINWFGIFYLIFILLCSYVLYYIFSKYIKWYFSLVLTWIIEIISLSWIHFSVISYLCIATAILLIAEILFNQKNRTIVLVIILVVLFNTSLILRTDCIVTGILLGVPVLLSVFFRKESRNYINIKSIIKCIVIECIALAIIFGVEKYSYSNSTWINYRQYNSVRHNALDYEISNYNEIKEKTDVDWSENDLNSLKAWVFADKEVYSSDNLSSVINSTNISERYNLNVIDVVINMIKLKETLFFILIFLFFIIFSKTNRKYIFLQGIFTFGLIGCLFVLQRALQRIYIGIYLIGIIYMLFLYLKDTERKTSYKMLKTIFTTAIFCGIIMFTLSYVRYSYNTTKMLKIREKIYQEEREYILNNKDKFFVSYKFFEVLQYQSIMDIGFEDKYENLSCLGSWDMYTETYYKQAEKYHFKNKDSILMNLVDNDNFYFIAQKDYASFPVLDLLTKFLEEHSREKIKSEKIKVFETSGDTLYKFSTY